MKQQKQSYLERKVDAHKKIMLGGLVVKAGVDYFHPHDPATLQGLLLYGKELMRNDPTIAAKFRELGKELIEKR